MIEELIAKVFATRNNAHLEHWRTGSFAAHMALGDFYEDVIETVDKLVEAYQGNFGKVKVVPDIKQSHNDDCIKCLSEDVAWIAKNRSKIARNVASLENIVDELTGLYLKALYKLENLS
jgi:hypothetical protein